VLTVESGADRRNVYIRRGSLMFATSTMQSELFGEYLLSEGVINEEELVAALAKSRELGLRIGETLVTMGMLAPTKLIEVLQDQVRNKIINLFSWIEGAYIFRPGGKFPEDSIRLKIPTPRLVLDGVIEHMPADRIEEVLGPMMDRRPVVEFDVLVNEDSLALHPRQYRVLRAIMSSETLGKALDSVTGFGTVPRKTAISIAYVLHEAGVLKFV
jgi:hypothetical protein